jgi:hypothetical protein
MPKLVTQATVTVIRDGKRVTPPIGKSFNYTTDEADYIRKQHPLGLRKPVNEDAPLSDDRPAGGESEQEAGAQDVGKTANISPKGKKGKKAKGKPIAADETVDDDDADDNAADEDEDI